jgi:hypothetical protein
MFRCRATSAIPSGRVNLTPVNPRSDRRVNSRNRRMNAHTLPGVCPGAAARRRSSTADRRAILRLGQRFEAFVRFTPANIRSNRDLEAAVANLIPGRRTPLPAAGYRILRREFPPKGGRPIAQISTRSGRGLP